MAPRHRTLHIHWASLNHFHSTASNAEDVRRACNTGADVIGFDECIGIRGSLSRIARSEGYRAVYWSDSQEAFLVKDDHHIFARGHQQMTPHIVWSSKRHISWVGFNFYGQRVYFHAAHWMIHVGESGHVRSNASRAKMHTKITDGMIRYVHRHGKGNNLAFFGGDTNVNEKIDNRVNDHRLINYRFNRAGLRTIWDEKRVFPGTHGRSTIDIIGKYDPNKRVDGKRYKVWPKRNSDHKPVSVWYDIDMKGVKQTSSSTGSTAGGGATVNGKPSTTKKNYKWWDYSDYKDDTIYELTAALEDSDDAPDSG